MDEPITRGSWLDEFAMFTWSHAACVLILGGAIAAAAALGSRWRGTRRETMLRQAWAWTMLGFVTAVAVLYFTPRYYDPKVSFPLHVCDIAAFVACLALLIPARWMATLTVFWGLALCTQAFITPILTMGPAHLHFWFFWLSHTAIVGSAVYLIAVDRYRPTLRDLGLAWLMLFGYVGWVLPIDIANGWNYGYVGKDVPGGTIIERLGDWPQRVYWLGVLACVGMFVVYLGFLIPRLLSSRRPR